MGEPGVPPPRGNRLRQEVGRERESGDSRDSVLVGGGERNRPRQIPDREIGGRGEDETRGPAQPRVAMLCASPEPQEPGGADCQRHGEGGPVRETQLLEPGRQGVARLEDRVVGERADGAQPVEPVPPGRDRSHRHEGGGDADSADRPAPSTRAERSEHEEDERHPLDEDREHPGGSRELVPTGHGEGDRRRGEPSHERVVVPAAGEVHGENGVPADERDRERGARRYARDGDHRRRIAAAARLL